MKKLVLAVQVMTHLIIIICNYLIYAMEGNFKVLVALILSPLLLMYQIKITNNNEQK